jgi:hypothetical protein
LYPSESWGERTVFRSISLDVGVAVVLVAVTVVVAVETQRIGNLLIGASVVACLLVGLRITLERMLERIANDSYDSGKAAERHAIVRDLAEYVERKNQAG